VSDRWLRRNLLVAGVFGAILIVTGLVGVLARDPAGLMSQAVPYDLFHIAFGGLAVGLALRGHRTGAALFNLGFGLGDLWQVVAGLTGLFPATLFALKPGDHVVHLVLGVLLSGCGIAGLRATDSRRPPRGR
jgi:hypothetical protein